MKNILLSILLTTMAITVSANPLCESAQDNADQRYIELQAAQATGNQALIIEAWNRWLAAQRAVTLYCSGGE